MHQRRKKYRCYMNLVDTTWKPAFDNLIHFGFYIFNELGINGAIWRKEQKMSYLSYMLVDAHKLSAYGHTTRKAPVPVRSPKLNRVGPG